MIALTAFGSSLRRAMPILLAVIVKTNKGAGKRNKERAGDDVTIDSNMKEIIATTTPNPILAGNE